MGRKYSWWIEQIQTLIPALAAVAKMLDAAIQQDQALLILNLFANTFVMELRSDGSQRWSDLSEVVEKSWHLCFYSDLALDYTLRIPELCSQLLDSVPKSFQDKIRRELKLTELVSEIGLALILVHLRERVRSEWTNTWKMTAIGSMKKCGRLKHALSITSGSWSV
jgi:hypothetical protein